MPPEHMAHACPGWPGTAGLHPRGTEGQSDPWAGCTWAPSFGNAVHPAAGPRLRLGMLLAPRSRCGGEGAARLLPSSAPGTPPSPSGFPERERT